MTRNCKSVRTNRGYGFGSKRLLIAGVVLVAVPAFGIITTATTLDMLRALNPHLTVRGDLALPLKLHAIMRDEYGFFRGTADLFYHWCRDHASDWLNRRELDVRLHGDVHVGNIGTYRVASATGLDLRFGLVDLDETIRGPYQLDLLRALTSLRFAALKQNIRVSEPQIWAVTARMCNEYRSAMLRTGSQSMSLQEFPPIRQTLHEARSADLGRYVARYIDAELPRFKRCRTDGDGTIKDVMLDVDRELNAQIIDSLWAYLSAGTCAATRDRFRLDSRDALAAEVLDIVAWVRIGSAGSQGLEKYLVLFEHPHFGRDHLLILQLKEEPRPAAARALLLDAEPGTDRAEEVADAYAQMAEPAKWLVGHTTIRGRGFLVKTKDPWGVELSTKDIRNYSDLKMAAELMGTLLGRAHRISLRQSAPRHPAIREIALDVVNQVPWLAQRSKDVMTYLQEHLRLLRNDSEARSLQKRAEDYIDSMRSDGAHRLAQERVDQPVD